MILIDYLFQSKMARSMDNMTFQVIMNRELCWPTILQGRGVQHLAELDPLHRACWGDCQALCEAGFKGNQFILSE